MKVGECDGDSSNTEEQNTMEEQKIVAATVTAKQNKSPNDLSRKAETAVKVIPVPTPVTIPGRGSLPESWVRSEVAGIPIPSALKTSDHSAYSIAGQDSQRFTVPNSWRAFQTPSSWGGSSVAFNDDACSLYGGDDQSDRGTDKGSVVGMSYARKRRLLRRLSKSSLTASRHSLPSVKEKWTKKLEDFREYEVGIWNSVLPLKAGVGASLAACLCFAPFVPDLLMYYGTVAVLGVGMSLESNVGLTLQKGANLMLGSALAGACALVVNLVEPFTGIFRVYFLITCVFLGGFLPRLISLPAIVKTRWAQTLTYYISIFHGLVLNKSIQMQYTAQFFLNCVCYSAGFLIVLFLTLCVKPDYAGDAMLVLLVSDFHTAGVVLERIVEDYRSGTVLTKIQELLSGDVKEDHIHHDLQYIIKSTDEAEKLMNAVRWEPSHGKFFSGYPWDLYPTLLAMLQHVMYDLISLDSALRGEIQAPLDIRQLFSEDMDVVARECSMLFHKVGDALLEHKKIDYHSNVERANLATLSLRKKLVKHSASVIAQDLTHYPLSGQMTRDPSRNSILDAFGELPSPISTISTPPPSPQDVERVIEQDLETSRKLNIDTDDWREKLFERRQSISEHWEETQQQISSLSFVKFASILIEFMGKVKLLVTMVDEISIKARFIEES